jgi:hypothetical protein
MSVWGEFAGAYGIGGGWFAGFAIIGTMWFMNHWIGLINNDGAFVDMALGIGVAGTTKVMFLEGFSAGTAALPTLLIALAGGACGGFMAYQLEQMMAKNAAEEAEVIAEAKGA